MKRCAQLTCRLMLAVVAVVSNAVICHAADIGSPAPQWKYIPGTDDQLHSLSEHQDAKVIVVAFLCNKCPCVKGYETRFNRFVDTYAGQGVQFVAFNSSHGDLENMPEMKRRAAGLKFDYLRDANQQVGKAFGATSTPHVFILNQERKIVYSGAFDDNRAEAVVKKHYVHDVVQALLSGSPVPVSRTRQFGCAITYR